MRRTRQDGLLEIIFSYRQSRRPGSPCPKHSIGELNDNQGGRSVVCSLRGSTEVLLTKMS